MRLYSVPYKDLVATVSDYIQGVRICRHCGFIWNDTPLSEEQLNRRYKAFSKYEFDASDYVLHEPEDYKCRCISQKNFIENSLKEDTFSSMLEVGAASGYNLSLYKGKSVFGVEPSRRNCENAKKIYGVQMYPGVFAEYIKEYNEKQYDLIFLSHTLEHIVNPCDFIKECAVINSKFFFVEVPTLDYKMNDEPYGMFTDEHVNIFTLEGLQSLMNECGYTLVNAEIPFYLDQPVPSGNPAIRTLWKKADVVRRYEPIVKTEILLEQYMKNSEASVKLLQDKIAKIPAKAKLAVWGVGNTASRILASSTLAEKNIVRVYDSDRKKHGHIFAGCAIQAFSEKDVEEGLVDTILITTYTAQNAIERFLQKYKDKINITILYNI